MDKEILQIPAMITGDRSLINGARKLTIETQENINIENLKVLLDMEGKLGWFNFAMRKIKPEDLIDLPPLDETKLDIKKSPSQRLRNILYVYFEKRGGKKGMFDLFYCKEIERIIQSYKNKLED
jgi:hypothetical protein